MNGLRHDHIMVARLQQTARAQGTDLMRLAEATASDLLAWTEGRALIATGSPAGAVLYNGTLYRIAQANNAFIFPGVELGAIVARASRITDCMLAASAQAIADWMVARDQPAYGASLLPRVDDLRAVSVEVAQAVGMAAAADGVACAPVNDLPRRIRDAMWEPVYPRMAPDRPRARAQVRRRASTPPQ